jgi:hypothetical protein
MASKIFFKGQQAGMANSKKVKQRYPHSPSGAPFGRFSGARFRQIARKIAKRGKI